MSISDHGAGCISLVRAAVKDGELQGHGGDAVVALQGGHVLTDVPPRGQCMMLDRGNIAGLWEVGVFEIVAFHAAGLTPLARQGVGAPVEDDGDYSPEAIVVIVVNLIEQRSSDYSI
jgi:hypothetical protein